ncbi:beta-glucanase [Pelobium manganitolerans]|uniref:Beta-glucanase n=1 Tax=Pelobium manganitolerans TaxID=1842495 RepID=A0A419S724_9SPHI|nr:glycoside hydrolase family 43 protein [Pelobium manganitolerans]RKD17124.1 beta-glucanase [Pelobium manganitolerans]
MRNRTSAFLLLICIAASTTFAQQQAIVPAQPWADTDGVPINAHGGGVILQKGKYYWFGEKRGRSASEGVSVYSSKDLVSWNNEGLALALRDNPNSDITKGAIIERPKVIYNPKTKKYVMWFHLELKGQGYKAARAGVAVSDAITGPFQFIESFRPNDNMSRDMTLFVDDDGSAYHLYSSNENYDLRVAKLTDDFLRPTTQDSLLFSKHREAPAIFKVGKQYYLITSACTGWAPNKASLHKANSIFGPWEYAGDPLHGPLAEITYGGQSTFVLPITQNKFVFMADKWNPQDLKNSTYIWLPLQVNAEGEVAVHWKEKWSPADL